MSAVQVFWKHWEKEKLLITSNFSFSHNFFYLFGEPFAIFIKLTLSSAKSFSLKEFPVKFWFWKGLMHFHDDLYQAIRRIIIDL